MFRPLPVHSRVCRPGLGAGFALIFASVILAVGKADDGGPRNLLWVDDSHADFSRGRLSASGRNFHVTHAGSLKQVFHYDLNADGWADLLFNSAHDFVLAPPVKLVDVAPNGTSSSRDLPGVGAKLIKTGDFDADGRTDLLVIEETRWVNTRNYLHVYWGTESGQWDQTVQTDLLAESARDVEVVDWDGDGRDDIVVLMNADNGGPGGTSSRVLRVYWGRKDGFLQSDSIDLSAGDIDEIERFSAHGPLLALAGGGTILRRLALDDRRKLLATEYRLTAGKIGSLRVHASRTGALILASAEPGEDSEADPTTARTSKIWSRLVRLELADNGTVASVSSPTLTHSDFFWSAQQPDLLLAADVSKAERSAQLLIQFDPQTMQFGASRDLPGPGYVSGAAFARRGDSPVIALARFRNEQSYDAASAIIPLADVLQGTAAEKDGEKVHTQGATGVVEVPPSAADKWAGSRLAFLNRISGSYVEFVPAMIHWGSREGFSPTRRLDIPFYSGILGAGADVNDDGRTDLVLVSQVHNVHSSKPYMGFHVFSGTDDHSFSNATILEEYGVRGMALADIDRDGWIDLVGVVLHGGADGRGWVIWRGGPDGFSRSRREFISFPQAHGLPAIADVDGDGWLDVAVPSMKSNEIRIYRSDRGRFDAARFDALPAWQANQLDFADMNGDGHLDLVSASGLGPGSFFRDYGIQIFWGGAQGYDPKRAQRLPAHGAVGFLIQDWDQDGRLDLFAPNYHSGIMREGTSARIYWGSASGLDSGRYTYLPVDGAAGAFATDFNGDGTLDLAISSHTTDGSHHTLSPVYYNKGGRFGEPRERVLLPTIGPQQMYSSSAGDQYGRRLHEWFESPPIPLRGSRQVKISAASRIPATAALQISFRAAATEAGLAGAAWQQAPRGEWLPLPAAFTTAQYRVDFHAGWRDAAYPELERVEIEGK